jgi:phosphinothricin acetyltransferase
MNVIVREASLGDLPSLTDLYNHYILHTPITFDLEPYRPEQRLAWFEEHSDGRRYRLLVACDPQGGILGYASSGRFRPKAAYEPTVETSVYCRPEASGQGIGTLLYRTLFEAIADQDIHRIVAGITEPNAASAALHRRFSFRSVGTFTQMGRKFGKYWDVTWLERPLKLEA